MSNYPEIAAQFARDTASHEMAVLFDQGLYRHLRFASPDGSGYRFDLHTSPNRLMFVGEVGTYVFSVFPTEDMFQLLRESSVGDRPNFGYWNEKLKAWNEPAIQFSIELFDWHVAKELAQAEEFYPGITEAWREHTEGVLCDHSTESEESAREALAAFEYLPRGQWGEAWRFRRAGEWKLDDYDWRYLWACHGALYGALRYDAAKAVAA
ncbi:hypothetical protein M2164_005860 [Streptomyces sp. SAI-208]|uniref:hypothetical protein n=1 Tax=Streptomyces sp. SAI-208 TaxID=2940550 RepID=UPI00247482A4|nr:hypothetical protein [Streptomyces sp. SAI-208]MDH6610225.1 hypothetical protein [Streptomyces sp. SAI-208]